MDRVAAAKAGSFALYRGVEQDDKMDLIEVRFGSVIDEPVD